MGTTDTTISPNFCLISAMYFLCSSTLFLMYSGVSELLASSGGYTWLTTMPAASSPSDENISNAFSVSSMDILSGVMTTMSAEVSLLVIMFRNATILSLMYCSSFSISSS